MDISKLNRTNQNRSKAGQSRKGERPRGGVNMLAGFVGNMPGTISHMADEQNPINRSKGDPKLSNEAKEILRKVAFNEDFVDELQAGVADDPAFNDPLQTPKRPVL